MDSKKGVEVNDSLRQLRHDPGAYLKLILPRRRIQVKIIHIACKLLIAIHQVFLATLVGTAALLLRGFLVSGGDVGILFVSV